MTTDHQSELETAQQAEQQYLTFSLGNEEYAVDILRVREIRSWSDPTPLPHAHDHVLGAMNLRGAIIPIVDLRRQFSLERCEYGSTIGVIVVQTVVMGAERQVGLVVDRVLDVSYLELAQSDFTEGQHASIGARFVSGLSQKDRGLVIIVDLEEIVSASLSGDSVPEELGV